MEKNMKRSKEKKSKKKLWLWIVGSLLTIFLIFIGTAYFTIQKTMNKINTPLLQTTDAAQLEEKTVIKKEPFSVLMLGVDERKDDSGRSDTMIVITVNPEKQTMKMLSIPRDTRTEIVGHDTVDKINHAYAFGGVPMAVDTVENFLNIPIDYYVFINMEGFLQIIDTLGGVTINNDMELTYDEYHYPKGEITLDGNEALIFSRIRYEDPRGDFGRQIRQRQIIEAVMKKASTPSTLLKATDMLTVLGDNVRMNFSVKELIQLQGIYKKMDKGIEQLSFEQGDGERINRIWYYIPNEEELQKIQADLKNHLQSK
ncbi:transcriptional regulator [Lysinibacillus fusiformis]|jgi:LCP family protein required for cell wall assembly|uniref:LCP family glycopolymer transferase n=1 Tax=Lysinibacillus TaxID=400634 RepID=UPI0004D9CF43|nr:MULTISPECIES: LCP family protein [Lysinibacillus]MDC6267150.1 LCP family protein [Lysinibacillus sphaericus]AJK87477.1 transcriptional regulator [Lysinibacillus fusiformis]KAB0443866.1 transcriptional regulator [Lysinibacillus fusiformis]KHK53114.1 transcriptional regulator [Lysinibacillus sp. A1]MCE4044123.1 LCP family protein [Lysinibacillus fusiformis]